MRTHFYIDGKHTQQVLLSQSFRTTFVLSNVHTAKFWQHTGISCIWCHCYVKVVHPELHSKKTLESRAARLTGTSLVQLLFLVILWVGTHLEAAENERDDDVAFLLRHFLRDSEKHQHVVALGHAERVQITQHVGARDLSLKTVHGQRLNGLRRDVFLQLQTSISSTR